MTAKEFERQLASLAGLPASEIDQRVRPLRKHGFLEAGGRGLYAPAINPAQASVMLLTLVSRRAVEGAEVAINAQKLRSSVKVEKECLESLLALIAFQMKVPDFPFLKKLTLSENGREAWTIINVNDLLSEVHWTDSSEFNCKFEVDYKEEELDGFFIERQFVIGGELIRECGRLLSKS